MVFQGLSVSVVTISARYLFLVVDAVLNLGSTENLFFQYLLEETALRTSLACVFPKTCASISPSSYICGVAFQGLSVIILIIKERYLFLVDAVLNLCFLDQRLLEETTLRTSLAFVVHIRANCIHPVYFEGKKTQWLSKGRLYIYIYKITRRSAPCSKCKSLLIF